jgi:ABC-type Na+ efflux pump permease subunit
MELDPWKMPPRPAEQCTSEERKEWLAHYDATAPERERQSASFERTAAISMMVSLMLPLLIFMVSTSASKIFH